MDSTAEETARKPSEIAQRNDVRASEDFGTPALENEHLTSAEAERDEWRAMIREDMKRGGLFDQVFTTPSPESIDWHAFADLLGGRVSKIQAGHACIAWTAADGDIDHDAWFSPDMAEQITAALSKARQS